jgi:hypothetical protein
MENTEIKNIIKELLLVEEKIGEYGNGKKAPYRRYIDNNKEYTLVGSINDIAGAYLYIGEIGATVSRLKEGRREDNLIINGEKTKWASLFANNIKSEDSFFKTC